MTADGLFSLAIGLAGGGEEDREDYGEQFLPVLNVLLAETFDVNNSIRVYRSKEELTEIPEVTALTDELTYEPEVLRKVLPYGIAGTLYQEDSASIAMQYMNKYEVARMGAGKAQHVEITDYYSEDEE